MAATAPARPTPETTAGVHIVRERGLGRITLDRPAALNALTRDMKRAMAEAIRRWTGDPEIYALVLDSACDRAFSVGGDLMELAALDGNLDEALGLQAEESRLVWQIECCIKPSVALINGLVMGAGAGLSMFGTHRVAGPAYSFAMPETGIGYFPNSGATAFLGRLPDHIGIYLGLTGASVGPADAFALGLVTHCIGPEHYDDIRRALADADPIDPLLDARHVAPSDGELARRRTGIARCFGEPTVDAILTALERETGSDRDWARATAAAITKRAPTSLAVALRQLRTAGELDLKDALEREHRLAVHLLSRPDLQEGIRSALSAKGAMPRWQPATLTEVPGAMVDAAFAPVGARELILLPRPESLVVS